MIKLYNVTLESANNILHQADLSNAYGCVTFCGK